MFWIGDVRGAAKPFRNWNVEQRTESPCYWDLNGAHDDQHIFERSVLQDLSIAKSSLGVLT